MSLLRITPIRRVLNHLCCVISLLAWVTITGRLREKKPGKFFVIYLRLLVVAEALDSKRLLSLP